MPPEAGKPLQGLGAKAYEAELTRLLGDFVVFDGHVPAIDLAEAISRVGEAAADEDFLGAIRLLGEVGGALARAPASDRRAGGARRRRTGAWRPSPRAPTLGLRRGA